MNKGKTKDFWWTEEKVALLAEHYRDGLTMDEVGAKYGITKQRVDQLFKRYKIKTRKYTVSKTLAGRCDRRHLIPEQLLTELYVNSKLEVKDILKHLKRSSRVLYQSLAFHQIPKRRNKLRQSSLTYELLHRMYITEKLPADEIARRLGFAPVTVKDRLSKFGIKKQQIRKR